MDCYLGWDVGGWNCDRNRNSRDALVALNGIGAGIGAPWRGNLRECVNTAASTSEFLGHLLSLCQLDEIKIEDAKVVLAIDAPLGFPAAFRTLLLSEPMSGEIGTSAKNEYLYRLTERRLFSEGVQPLSAIKDMIGSQATKAMHVVAKFAPKSNEVGVWTDGGNFTVIETYPALCRDRLGHTKPDLFGREADIADARVCAHIAQEFRKRRENLEAPVEGVPEGEGWIWAPFRQ